MEHRWGRRILVDIPVRIQLAESSGSRPAKLLNISVTGALLAAEFQLRPLSRVQIVEFIGASGRRVMSVAAYVAALHPHGMGIEWCELANPLVGDWMSASAEPMPQLLLPQLESSLTA